MLLRAAVFLAFFVPLWAWELYQGWNVLTALYPAESAEVVALDPSGFVRLFILSIAVVIAGSPSLFGHLAAVRRRPGSPGRLSRLWRSAVAAIMTFFLIRQLLPATADLNRLLDFPAGVSVLLCLGIFALAAAFVTAAVEYVGNRIEVPTRFVHQLR